LIGEEKERGKHNSCPLQSLARVEEKEGEKEKSGVWHPCGCARRWGRKIRGGKVDHCCANGNNSEVHDAKKKKKKTQEALVFPLLVEGKKKKGVNSTFPDSGLAD